MNKYYPYTNPIYKKNRVLYRRCNKCGCHKDISLFNKNKRNTNGLSDYCRICNRKYSSKFRKLNKKLCNERIKRWREKHPQKALEYRKKCQKSEKSKLWRNEYLKKRRETDSDFNLRCNMSRRIRQCLKSTKTRKSNPTLKLLGCSIKEFKSYLESKFQKGMTWENYGLLGWHIDHIFPVSSFNLTKEDEQKKCFHYTNLQPMWMLENIKKSNKLPTQQLELVGQR